MKRFLSLWLVLAIGVALSAGMVGCGGDDTTKPEVNEYDLLSGLGDTYFTSYTTPGGLGVNITASELYGLMTDADANNDPYIISWRSATDYANAGHIEGAVNAGSVSTADIDAVLAAIPAGKTVVNYCHTGQSASYVTAYMNMLGYNARNLSFGMCGWTADTAANLSKYATATSNDYNDWLTTVASTATETYSAPTVDTGEETANAILRSYLTDNFNTSFKTIKIADLYADIEVNGKADEYFIINYFADAQYNAGHIPGAVQYVPKQDLRSDKKLANIPTDKKVVVYCFTGQTSGQVIAYLRALGYDAYSLSFGTGSMCYDNTSVASSRYTVPTTNYPVVTGS